MADLKDYQDLINLKAEENSTDVLPNAGKDHAAIVMSKLFDKTETSAKMVVGSFTGIVSNQCNYMNSLKNCVERNISFKIIFLDDPNTESSAYKYLCLKKEEGADIEFKKAGAAFLEKVRKDSEKHFAVFDDNKFRLENDTLNYIAWVCFNDKKNTAVLNNIFDAAFQAAIPIDELEVA